MLILPHVAELSPETKARLFGLYLAEAFAGTPSRVRPVPTVPMPLPATPAPALDYCRVCGCTYADPASRVCDYPYCYESPLFEAVDKEIEAVNA